MKLIFGIIGIVLLQSVAQINGQDIPIDFCVNKTNGAYPHPDPDRCGSFVICVGFPILQECDPNKIFVPEEGAEPPYGECQPGYPETCQLATEAPTTIGTTTEYPEIPREICEGILFRRIPHPTNCYQYFFCIAQVPHLGECLSHQIFHPEWNICIRGNRDTCRFCLFC